VRLRLLPQPAHERVVLELEAAEAAQGVRLMVSDVLGRVVAEPLRGAVLPPGVQQRIELDVRAWAIGAVHGGAAHGGGQHCRAARGGALRHGFALAEGIAS
jgi:hypothetical protein